MYPPLTQLETRRRDHAIRHVLKDDIRAARARTRDSRRRNCRRHRPAILLWTCGLTPRLARIVGRWLEPAGA